MRPSSWTFVEFSGWTFGDAFALKLTNIIRARRSFCIYTGLNKTIKRWDHGTSPLRASLIVCVAIEIWVQIIGMGFRKKNNVVPVWQCPKIHQTWTVSPGGFWFATRRWWLKSLMWNPLSPELIWSLLRHLRKDKNITKHIIGC